MNKKDKLMFRVKYGFDKMAHVTVEAGPELEKAIYAWVEQIPVSIGGKMIQGKYIVSIEQDYHYYTGWYESYQPTNGDDFAQIARDCPDIEGYIEAYRTRVNSLISTGRTDLIGTGEPLKVEQAKVLKEGSPYAKQLLASKSLVDSSEERR